MSLQFIPFPVPDMAAVAVDMLVAAILNTIVAEVVAEDVAIRTRAEMWHQHQ